MPPPAVLQLLLRRRVVPVGTVRGLPVRPVRRSAMLKKGIPVSPGVAVARAFCVDAAQARRETTHLDVAALSGEVRRFDEAVQAAAAELDAIVERVTRQ